MKTKYKFLIYVIALECFILIAFNLSSNKTLKRILGTTVNHDVTLLANSLAINLEDNGEFCFKAYIDANNPIAMKHYRENIQRYMPEFNQCSAKEKAVDLIQIDENNTLHIDVNGILKRYDLAIKLECYAQSIDKLVDKKERDFNLKYSHRYLVNSKLILNEHGFYYIHCVDEANKLRVIHQDIRLVLPKYMSYLKTKSKSYFQKVDAVRDEQLDSDNSVNPLLNDLNLLTDECLLNTATENVKNLNKFNPKMNVLILGIDSLSYPHLKRSFPRFYKFLSQELTGNVFYENLNKVGENTHPNLLAMFAGVKTEPYLEMNIRNADIDAYYAWDKNSTNHDLIPFIWRSYDKDLNYLTMYNEEWAYFGCFNYLKHGFRYYPAHYYSHPFWFKYEKMSENTNNSRLCFNNEPFYSKSLNKIRQLIDQMNSNDANKKLPYFSFNFLKYYTHDYLVAPSGFDAELTDLLQQFEKKSYLDKTLLIVMSDHGNRLSQYGFYTEPGRIERSMPFISIRLPKQLHNTQFHKNIQSNRNKLISIFDIYKTLAHFKYINEFGIEPMLNQSCRHNFKQSQPEIRSMRGISLFEPVAANRTCLDALVPSSYCLCTLKQSINEITYLNETKYTFKQSGELIVDFINEMTNSYRSQCIPFTLSQVKSVKKLKYSADTWLYNVQLVLTPGESVFEANLKLNKQQKLKVYENKVNRLSKYRQQSKVYYFFSYFLLFLL